MLGRELKVNSQRVIDFKSRQLTDLNKAQNEAIASGLNNRGPNNNKLLFDREMKRSVCINPVTHTNPKNHLVIE